MKKYFALIVSIILILTCFTACKPKLKGGLVISDAGGANYAAVTNENGGIARDEAGNLVVLVTDAKGRNVKDENGEYQTNAVAIERPIVLGRRIECPLYAINIPDGWSDNFTASDLIIKRDNSADQIKIITAGDADLNNVMQASQLLLENANKKYGDSVYTNKSLKIGNIDTSFISLFIPEATSGKPIYYGYMFFTQAGKVYTVMLTSDRDMTGNLDEVIDILETIEFIY